MADMLKKYLLFPVNSTEVNLLEQYIKKIQGRNGLTRQEYLNLINQDFQRSYDI